MVDNADQARAGLRMIEGDWRFVAMTESGSRRVYSSPDGKQGLLFNMTERAVWLYDDVQSAFAFGGGWVDPPNPGEQLDDELRAFSDGPLGVTPVPRSG